MTLKRTSFLWLASMLLVALSGCGEGRFTEPQPEPSEHAVYVWQRQWSPETGAALDQASQSVQTWMVLAGDLEKRDDALNYVHVRADWSRLAQTGLDVWLVVRLCADCLDGRDVLHPDLFSRIDVAVQAARRGGVNLAGLQMDYDSPTELLPGYAYFLGELRAAFPNMPISITALPTWLRHPAFPEVLAGLDHYVLQVHWLDRPGSLDDPLILFDAEKAPGWLEEASRLRVPFYLALPTYGYRVYYDARGRYAGLGAEQHHHLPPGHRFRDVHANPSRIAPLVRSLDEYRPEACRGIAWFRLPVDGDAFNWSWPVLEAVMQGKVLEPSITAEVRAPREHLYEVWVESPDYGYPGEVRVPVTVLNGTVLASDAINGFRTSPSDDIGRVDLVGSVPAGASARMIFWVFVEPGLNEAAVVVATGEVEVL